MRIPAMAIAGAGLLAGCATTELPNEGPIEAAVYTANGPVVIGNFATVEDCAAQVRAAFEDVNARASVPTTFAGGALGGCATGDAFEGDDYYLVVPDGVMLGPKFKRAGSD